MRYTLRLLTLDQLGRAATLICALELVRQETPETLGAWPFEIGLWVGKAATPNRMGEKGETDKTTARAKTDRVSTRQQQSVADSARELPVVRHQAGADVVQARSRMRIEPHEPPARRAATCRARSRARTRCRSSRSTSRSTGGCRAS